MGDPQNGMPHSLRDLETQRSSCKHYPQGLVVAQVVAAVALVAAALLQAAAVVVVVVVKEVVVTRVAVRVVRQVKESWERGLLKRM
jgi:hypothetical protein